MRRGDEYKRGRDSTVRGRILLLNELQVGYGVLCFFQHGVIGNRTNTHKARQEQKHSIAEAKNEDSAYLHLENERKRMR